MGCKWGSKDGKRIRISSVSSPVVAQQIGSFSIQGILDLLNLVSVSGSPTFTREDLRDAELRLYLDPEKGYVVESRIRPGAQPNYHWIPQSEATELEIRRPSPSFIARMFHVSEPVAY